MTRGSAHNMSLNEKVSGQQHDPNFMKQNRTNTCVNRQKGAGRKSTTRSSCDLRAQCWPINSLCLSSMQWQSIISPHRKAGTGTFPSSGTLCLGPNRDSRPQIRKLVCKSQPMLKEKHSRVHSAASSFCSKKKGWAPFAVSPPEQERCRPPQEASTGLRNTRQTPCLLGSP